MQRNNSDRSERSTLFSWASSLWKPHGFLQIKELIDHNDDLAIIFSFNLVNSSLYFEAYTPIPSFSPSVLSRIYLSACDFPDSTCNTFSRQDTLSIASQDLLPFVDLFLSQKKKYKPVAKRTRPVIAELPDKFRIVRKINGDPLADLLLLNPNPPPFQPTERYSIERRDRLDKNHPGEFLTPQEYAFMHDFMLKHETGFAWNDAERGSFQTNFFPPVDFPVVPHTPWIDQYHQAFLIKSAQSFERS